MNTITAPRLLLAVLLCLGTGAAQAKAIFVKGDAPPGGDGTSNAPYSTLLEVELNSADDDSIFVLRSELALDGGITLKNGQRIQGFNQSLCQSEPYFECDLDGAASIITNTAGGSGIVLANNNRVSWLAIVGVYRGYGILGDNVTKSDISHVFISEVNTSGLDDPNRDAFTGTYCNLLANIYRGCWPLVLATTVSGPFAGISFANDNTAGEIASNRVSHSTIQNVTGSLLLVASAGTVHSTVRLRNLQLLNPAESPSGLASGVSIGIFSAEDSNLEVNIEDVILEERHDFGLVGAIGFAASGFTALLPPFGDPTQVLNIDGLIDANQSGSAINDSLEIVSIQAPGLFGQGPLGRVEAHIQNSTFVGNPNNFGLEFALDAPGFGPLRTASVFDMGCVDPTCGPEFTSIGKNRIFGNGRFVSYINGIGVDIALTDYSGYGAVLKAQNNWWGTTAGAGDCFWLDTTPIPAIPEEFNCMANQNGSIDTSHHLSADPAD